MCGILLELSDQKIDVERFSAALNTLKHRGPDSQNLAWNYKNSDQLILSQNNTTNHEDQIKMIIGHTRLSIIDLTSASQQPMISENDEYALIYNGEIYNYKEIRKELINEGVEFTSTGDTEVLFRAIMHWGIDCLQRLNGMWSFIFFDRSKQKLYLSRDPFGKKPLYYYFKKNKFIASSEFKAIFYLLGKSKRKVSAEYLCSYLFNGHDPTFKNGKTFYKEISTVGEGELLEYDIQKNQIKKNRHNSLKNYLQKNPNINDLEKDIESAVSLRLRADVPIGVLVSGGIDSSLIASIIKNNHKIDSSKITFYTANTEHSKDIYYAKKIADTLKIKLKVIDIPYGLSGVNSIKKMIKQYEIPIQLGGISSAAFYMYDIISRDGIKVVIDGTGGDELFAGYYKEYRAGYILSLIYSLNFSAAIKISRKKEYKKELLKIGSIRNLLKIFINSSKMMKLLTVKLFLMKKFSKNYSLRKNKVVEQILSNYYSRNNYRFGLNNFLNLKNVQLNDITRGKLPNWIFLGDQNSMNNSIELRSPLMDIRLLKYLNLNINEKVKNSFWKYPLRKIMEKYDQDIAWRNEKIGFEWDGERFLIENRNEIFTTYQKSSLISSIFDINNLKNNFEKIVNNYVIGKFYLRIYNVAVLDNLYNIELE